MIIVIESIILCILFTLMVLVMSKNPIKTLYNYPPQIQEKVKSLKEYKKQIPTTKNMLGAKLFVSLLIIVIISLILKYINGYQTFLEGFGYSFLLWTIVNVYDVLILDICWFCQSKKFIFEGTEDIIAEYKNYWFHIKEGLIGEIIGLIISLIVGLIIVFIL